MKGQPVRATISGKSFKRISLVAAQIDKQLVAPMIYDNTMICSLFEKWFEFSLLPALKTKSVIIMDNARFHHFNRLQSLAEKFGHSVLFLSPYSPELNPIEKTWGSLKRYLRKVVHSFDSIEEALESYFKVN